MQHTLARLLKPLLRRLIPAPCHGPASDPYTYITPCSYVGGPTVHRTGERPPRGEDSPLVRPYFVAHERRTAEAHAAEARRRRLQGGRLLVAVRGLDVGHMKGAAA
ncbi:hypothetical protein ACH5AG_20750 [Streptomyces anulatus]|uniref:hypothetical protein n=1 Tax=Streptomyces TaxID=1883 RepID=UPI00030359DD|nr:hypothetical protein [Streptomyces sp. W007]WTD09920.1 hypothetical protein OHA54_11965 [Streptomyces anulatus]WTE03226.1 hypothetical protein OH765_12065 [Streptomyces anulatus]